MKPFDKGWGGVLALGVSLALVLGVGCAREQPRGVLHGTRMLLAAQDDFGMLLLNAGLAPEQLPTEEPLSVEEARRLRLLLLLASEGSLRAYGPRLTAELLLGEVIAHQAALPRERLNARLRDYQHAAVMRPDGFMAAALTGTALQCVGPVQVQQGALRSGEYEVGVVYVQENGLWKRAAAALQPRSLTAARVPSPPAPEGPHAER